MNGKLTTPFFTGLLLLAGSFVLVYIIVAFYSRAQVALLMGRGISATDFAAPYFFVINRGAMLGLLLAIGTLGYGRLRLLISLFQPQVVYGVDGGIRVTTDFTALYLYVVSSGVLVGLLTASSVYVYWRRRLHAMADAGAFFVMHTGFIYLTVWWLPLIVATGSGLTLVFYLRQGDRLVN